MLHDPTYYALSIDEQQLQTFDWEEIGADNPKDRLLTAVRIAGVPHHLEAIAVQRVPDPDSDMRPAQVASSDYYADILDDYRAADGGTDEAFLTVEIHGREYCLFMTPFRE